MVGTVARKLLTRSVITFTVAITIGTGYLPLHEYGHCVFEWTRGSDSSCTVVYYHPTAAQPETWSQCTEHPRWGPNGTVIGKVLTCNSNHSASYHGTVAFAMTTPGYWYEHAILYTVLPLAIGVVLVIMIRWTIQPLRNTKEAPNP